MTATARTASKPTGITRAGRVATTCGWMTLVTLIALHVLKPELDPSWRMVSEYAIGDHGWLASMMFGLVAAGCVGAWRSLPRGRRPFLRLAGSVALALAVIGLLLGAAFPTDPITAAADELTTAGRLHGLGAMLGIPSLTAAAVLRHQLLRREPATETAGWPRFRATSHLVWASMLVFVASVAWFYDGSFHPGVRIGWQNRLVMVAYALWLVAAGSLGSGTPVRES